MLSYLIFLTTFLFSFYSLGIQLCFNNKLHYSSIKSLWNHSYPIQSKTHSLLYSNIRDSLRPDFSKESTFASYENRLFQDLDSFVNEEVNCFSNSTKNCFSFNNDENMIASKPYRDEDLIVKYHVNYTTLIHSTICDENPLQVIVGIPISPSQFAERHAIRETWCNNRSISYGKVRCIFFCGLSEIDSRIDSFVRDEAKKYNDIVQFGFRNSYLNLTLLQIYSYSWTLQHCSSFSYYVRADSDMFLNLRVTIKKIIPFPQKQFAYGILIRHGIPIRHALSKYYLPTWVYQYDSFPPYLSGCMYIWSRDVVETVLNGTEVVRPIHYIDDVYYGQIFQKNNLTLRTDYKNLYWYQIPMSQKLWRRVVAAHRYSPIDLLSLWKMYS